jgi:hypothetical protein
MASGWMDKEAPLPRSSFAALRRLRRRSRASWPIWVTLAVAATAVITARRAMVPTRHASTVVLRVREGALHAQDTDFGVGPLRSHVQDVVFTNKNLIQLMGRHPRIYRGLTKDPASEVEDFRKELSISIQGNDVQERSANDPPRSARIALTYHSPQPETAFEIARELADLLVNQAVARQRALATREQAAARSLIEHATADVDSSPAPDKAGEGRLRAAEARAAGAGMAAAAAEDDQVLRFQIVDQGRVPTASRTKEGVAAHAVLTLFAMLAAAGLLAGAFDPRVLDPDDLAELELPLLGLLPSQPTRHPARSGPDT